MSICRFDQLHNDVSTPLTTCKKKRKVRGKRSEAAKRSRRISNKMPLKPKMDKISDLPALINAGVETTVKKHIIQLINPIVKEAGRLVQTAVNNACRKAETKGRRTQTAAQHQKVCNKKWLKEKKQKADCKKVDFMNSKIGMRIAAGSSAEFEERRMLMRTIAAGVRKKAKSFQNATQQEVQRNRYRGERKREKKKA